LKQFSRPIFYPYELTSSILDPSTTIGFYVHPMNSLTSCLAFCAAKSGTKFVMVRSKMCGCISSKYIRLKSPGSNFWLVWNSKILKFFIWYPKYFFFNPDFNRIYIKYGCYASFKCIYKNLSAWWLDTWKVLLKLSPNYHFGDVNF